MGTARSGTTILEILFSNNHDILGVGELTHILRDGFLRDVKCSCGKPTSQCSLWWAVRQKCIWQQDKLPSFINLFHSIEWHSKFLLLALNLVSKETLGVYRDINQQLFQALESVSGNSIIVDSSKYAGRALALSKLFPGRVKILCVTRLPQELLNAFQNKKTLEQKPKNLIGILAYYVYVLICCRIVSMCVGRNVYQIRYDDLVADPIGVIKGIESWSGLALSRALSKISQGDFFEVGHIITGNRLRWKRRVRFQPNSSPKPVSGFRARFTLCIMNVFRFILRF